MKKEGVYFVLYARESAKPKVISEVIGSSSVAFTMNIYSHIIDGVREDAMALLDEVLPVGVSQKITAI